MPTTDILSPPSENELRLARRVLELEGERDSLAVRSPPSSTFLTLKKAELQTTRSRFPSHSTTIPIPSSTSLSSTHHQPITIPHELLPTLSLLRSHIAELTRDNEAMRYTFLGETDTIASSSKITLDVPVSMPPPPLPIDTSLRGMGERGQRLDLEAVLWRVKELVKENEELGEMVLEAGRGGGSEWQKALDGMCWARVGPTIAEENDADSKAVITSLE